MDPDETLRLIRLYAGVLTSGDGDDMAQSFAAASLAEHVEAIDTWLSAGGYLPRAWEKRDD